MSTARTAVAMLTAAVSATTPADNLLKSLILSSLGSVARGWRRPTGQPLPAKRITPKLRVTDVTFGRSFYDNGPQGCLKPKEKGRRLG
jgi:hypothetical protein